MFLHFVVLFFILLFHLFQGTFCWFLFCSLSSTVIRHINCFVSTRSKCCSFGAIKIAFLLAASCTQQIIFRWTLATIRRSKKREWWDCCVCYDALYAFFLLAIVIVVGTLFFFFSFLFGWPLVFNVDHLNASHLLCTKMNEAKNEKNSRFICFGHFLSSFAFTIFFLFPANTNTFTFGSSLYLFVGHLHGKFIK